MKAAALSWKLRPALSYSMFEAHLEEVVRKAADFGVRLLVLPENISFELRPMFDGPDAAFAKFLAGYSYAEFLASLSELHEMTIVGGTHFAFSGNGIENRALIAEEGCVGTVPKCVLTRWEIDRLDLVPGAGSRLFGDGRLGILVCYDVEFPRAARTLAEAGALAIAVPSFTETAHGFRRVRVCAHARAIELQIFVLHASLVGGLGVEPAPRATGTSAIIAPGTPPFPELGLLAETLPDEEGMAVADLDFDELLESRETGDVRNWHDRDRGDWRVGP